MRPVYLSVVAQEKQERGQKKNSSEAEIEIILSEDE